jgi:epoxyqueuosine reductase
VADGTPDWPQIVEWARQAGFPLASAVPVEVPPEARVRLESWLARGRHGSLSYMAAGAQQRLDPRTWLPWARSLLSVALPYNTSREGSEAWRDRGRMWVSRYAWGRDYHKVLGKRLSGLARRIELSGARARVCVDTSPLAERAYAVRAGLGFVGKNALLVHPEWGSYLFLGEILTDLSPPDFCPAPLSPGCENCDQCLRACPTGALRGPGDLDAGRCISAWTVERCGGRSHRPDLHGNLFGCDRCQEACPYNRGAPLTADPSFAPRPPWFAPRPGEILGLSGEEWERLTRGMVLRRAGYAKLLGNASRAECRGEGGLTRPEPLDHVQEPDRAENEAAIPELGLLQESPDRRKHDGDLEEHHGKAEGP